MQKRGDEEQISTLDKILLLDQSSGVPTLDKFV